MNYSELVRKCENNEIEAHIKSIAMGELILGRMAPRLEKDAVLKFQDLAWQFSKRLGSITSINDFDSYHSEFVQDFHNRIKNMEGNTPSYGEAQKPINLFLKIYVDGSSRPDATVARRLRPFLHMPLDSVIMKFFRSKFREDYEKFISPANRAVNEFIRKSNPKAPKIPDSVLSELQHIHQDAYFAWQAWFRQIYPKKPLLLDTVWYLER